MCNPHKKGFSSYCSSHLGTLNSQDSKAKVDIALKVNVYFKLQFHQWLDMVAVSYGIALLFQHNGSSIEFQIATGFKDQLCTPKTPWPLLYYKLGKKGGVTCDGSAPHGALLLGGVKMKELERNLFAYLI